MTAGGVGTLCEALSECTLLRGRTKDPTASEGRENGKSPRMRLREVAKSSQGSECRCCRQCAQKMTTKGFSL